MIIPFLSMAETIGTMTDARLVAGPTFLPDKAISYQNPYVVQSANRCSHYQECLSTYTFFLKRGKAEVFIPPRSKETGLPERISGDAL